MYRFAIVIMLSGFAMTACKKSTNSTDTAGQTNTDLDAQSNDQTTVSDATDDIANDVNTSLTATGSATGSSVTPGIRYGTTTTGGGLDTLKQAQQLICDATIVADTISNPHTITITYNGANCGGTRTRTGVIVASIPSGMHWKDAGAIVTVSIQNLKITRLYDHKSITINGTHTYTNVSGGSFVALYLGALPNGITHTVTSSNMSVTFDNGATRTWSVARQRLYNYVNKVLTVTISGAHTDGSTTGISEWGTNRFGNSFSTVIAQPLVFSSSCINRLISGQVVLKNGQGLATITFGLNADGAATGCPVAGAYFYFKLVWAGDGGKTYTVILPY
ncbi:MAG TPA: hypothetical protein VGM89_08110 [Puia sp.]